MKKTIMIMIILMLPLALADNETAELVVDVGTDQDLNATFYEYAEGNVNNNIFCISNNCTTNLFGGEVNVLNDTFNNFNQYANYYNTYTGGGSNGMTMKKFYIKMGSNLEKFFNGDDELFNDALNIWKLLDLVFVSHKEYQPTFINTLYLAEEMDRVKAENTLLRNYLNVTLDKEDIECQTAINKAERTGLEVTTASGIVVNLDRFGRVCMKLS